ncbi:hypothetical protein LOAG_02409 [Loa loa]|uniref:Uncharacterized protein n=2 Tax=Loa loa TaxID=7209 RepID=A0A1S0U6Q6_LOALO|nr:hypothetical protein LOAG_02409 [Loa loa]EFO26079.1 hypothetical protein LOAG_02409 [Loa loa]
MQPESIALNGDKLSNEEILEINSAYFSLRVAIIFLIVTVMLFVIIQFIKLICQIMRIYDEANKPFDSKTPEITVHSKKSTRRKKSKYSLPSKEMQIQLSLTNDREKNITPSDNREIIAKKEEEINNNKKKKKLPLLQNEVRNAPEIVMDDSDKLTPPDIKDSLAIFGSQKISSPIPISIKEKPETFVELKAQDSLMVVNKQTSLQPSRSAEKIKSEMGSEDKGHAFLAAKAQDSLMVVNDQKPLQPANSVEQTNLATTVKKEELKIAQQKEIEL